MKPIILAVAIAAALADNANAQSRAYLIGQWYENGSQMCRYDNGTVLNVGYRICPLSIPAR
jgi:hypothetical protein